MICSLSKAHDINSLLIVSDYFNTVGDHLLICRYIYTGKVSVPLCDTNVDFVDLIGAANEILLPQLVTSLEGYLVDMYLSESTKLLEVETWLQSNIVRLVSLKKGGYIVFYKMGVIFVSFSCILCFRYSGRFELNSITI